MVPSLNDKRYKKLFIIYILSVSDFEVAILISDVEDMIQVHNLNEFRYVFQ